MKPYHSLILDPALRSRKKTIADVPVRITLELSYKLFALMNLAWDYVDTICDLCIGLRISETKPLVRTIRQLKREYDRSRWPSTGQEFEKEEKERGLAIEEALADDLRKLHFSLENAVAKLDLKPDHCTLVVATQQALTLMDAAKIYARRCDKIFASYDVWVCDCVLMQTEFLKLYPLIPQFAGDCYQPDLSARKLTAGIIANKLEGMALPIMEEYEQYEQSRATTE